MYDVGTFVDRYQVEGVVGHDTVAVVYRVRHTMLGSVHALKLLNGANQAADRVVHGARAQASLHHPHIVAITDIVHVANRVGLVMELVEGGSLHAHLERGRIPFDRALSIFRCVVRGVRHAHERGVLHGAIDVRRVLLEPVDGRLVPKVTGFGAEGEASKEPVALRDLTQVNAQRRRVDPDLDLRRLGAMLYELVCGKAPTRAAEGLASPDGFADDMPDAVVKVTDALLRGDRMSVPSCQAILERLDRFEEIRERPTDVATGLPRRRSSRDPERLTLAPLDADEDEVTDPSV